MTPQTTHPERDNNKLTIGNIAFALDVLYTEYDNFCKATNDEPTFKGFWMWCRYTGRSLKGEIWVYE